MLNRKTRQEMAVLALMKDKNIGRIVSIPPTLASINLLYLTRGFKLNIIDISSCFNIVRVL